MVSDYADRCAADTVSLFQEVCITIEYGRDKHSRYQDEHLVYIA